MAWWLVHLTSNQEIRGFEHHWHGLCPRVRYRVSKQRLGPDITESLLTVTLNHEKITCNLHRYFKHSRAANSTDCGTNSQIQNATDMAVMVV